MSLRWKKLSGTTAAVPVRRGAKTLETRPCHLHLVRAETAPNANGGKQLVPLTDRPTHAQLCPPPSSSS